MLKAFKKLLSNGSVTRKTLFCLIFSKLPVLGLCLTKVMECYWWPKGFRFKGQVAEMMLYWKTKELLLPMPPVFLVFFFSTCMMPSFCFFIGRSDICKYVHNVWSHISKSEFPPADVISSFFRSVDSFFPGGRDRSILFSARYFLTGLPVQNLICQFLNKGTCLAKASGERNLPT